jgi:hypothetical protein
MMKAMSQISRRNGAASAAAVAVFVASACAANAAVLFDSGVTSLTALDPTQLGRLSRNAVPQDWSNTESFPGIINTSISYHYHTFDVAVPAATPFIHVTMDSALANTFASAYESSYNPTNLQTHWLGDAGASGNIFGNIPQTFDVTIATPGDDLILVVNDVSASGTGLGQDFDITAEAFPDTTSIPEPASLCLFGLGATMLLARRRRNA